MSEFGELWAAIRCKIKSTDSKSKDHFQFSYGKFSNGKNFRCQIFNWQIPYGKFSNDKFAMVNFQMANFLWQILKWQARAKAASLTFILLKRSTVSGVLCTVVGGKLVIGVNMLAISSARL